MGKKMTQKRRKELALCEKIAERASGLARGRSGYSYLDAYMDITTCHDKVQPLRLEELLAAEDFDFAHDVFGINRHLKRELPYALGGSFLPRFAVKEARRGG